MKYLNKIDDYQGENRSAITLGKFDGFHRGHQKLLGAVKHFVGMSENQDEKINSIVFAFDMCKFRQEHGMDYEQIMLPREQTEFLNTKVDCLIHCDFADEIRCMEAERFIEEIIVKKFRAKYIVVGSDFHFGYKAKGTVDMLRTYAEQFDYQVIEIEKETYGDQEISSSLIKTCIRNGEMENANAMLGYAYSVRGEVIHGKKLGRKLGFPTMNVRVNLEKILPLYGVYSVRVEIAGEFHSGIANVGEKPTVEVHGIPQVETYVFDYEGDAYGEEIVVKFLRFQRPETKFESVEALKQQVDGDIRDAKDYFEGSK
ncbi:MAG: bifunctional riboflavin kinase/FAD synthetase [Eubacteriales bacterium]